MSRRRFIIADDKWDRVVEYAEDTNRTTSELICEALDQIMARYPKRRHATECDLDALAIKVAEIIALRYPQVPLREDISDISWARHDGT
jgi:hypothetical protein